MNKFFSLIIISSLIYSFFNGSYDKVISQGILGVKKAIDILILLLSFNSFFSGILITIKKAGLTEKISKVFSKIVNPLFPEVKNSEIKGLISMNLALNFLGLSNIATPVGLSAMKKLKEENNNKNYATNSMCLLTVISTASFCLIPQNILALRMSFKSVNPYIVIIPIWICSFLGLLTGIISCKIAKRRRL